MSPALVVHVAVAGQRMVLPLFLLRMAPEFQAARAIRVGRALN